MHASPLVLDFLLRSLQVCLCKPTTHPSKCKSTNDPGGKSLRQDDCCRLHLAGPDKVYRDQISQAGSMLLFLRRAAPHSCLGEIKLQPGAKTGSWTQPSLNLGYTCQLFLHLEETLILISIKGTFVINLESCCENIYNPVLLVMSQHPFIERKVSEAS